jgi:hypothetical protein
MWPCPKEELPCGVAGFKSYFGHKETDELKI